MTPPEFFEQAVACMVGVVLYQLLAAWARVVQRQLVRLLHKRRVKRRAAEIANLQETVFDASTADLREMLEKDKP